MGFHLSSWLVAGAAMTLAAAGSAHAALLSVDFNAVSSTTTSPTQAGFSAANVDEFDKTTETYTFGAYTVNIEDLPGGVADPLIVKSGARDRSALAGHSTVSPLFRDFVFSNASDNAQRFALEVENLAANTPYYFTFWSFDNSASALQTITFTQIDLPAGTPVGPPAVTGSISYVTSEKPTSLADNSLILTATTNASGSVAFEVFGTDIAVLNGFEINAVPEPASIGLMMAGAGMMLLRRRG